MSSIVYVRGCPFPSHLHYDVANHMWYEPIDSELIRCGMTVIGPAMADRRIFAFTPKRVGRDVEAGKSCATIESSKWVGPARIAFDGVVIEVNEAAIERPALLVEDGYGRGWMMIVRPATENALAELITGDDVVPAYLGWMNDADFPGCSEGDTT
ncbi:MAG: glycine cleavage system protein H [Hyphomicrobiaceae bacterium]